jgi:hypothetical protein
VMLLVALFVNYLHDIFNGPILYVYNFLHEV